MAKGDGDGVGGIIRSGRRVQMQEPSHHINDLPFICAAISGDSLLHL